MKKLILSFSVIALIMIACEKHYEDGPLISLRSKEKRIIGDWKVSAIEGYKTRKLSDTVSYSISFLASKEFTLTTNYTKAKDLVQTGTWELTEDGCWILVRSLAMVGVDTVVSHFYIDSALYGKNFIDFRIHELRMNRLKLDASMGADLTLERQ